MWRYPVKSMHGELLRSVKLNEHGVAGDRRYAFESSGAPPGMLRVTGAERGRLLLCRATTDEATGDVTIFTPEGEGLAVQDQSLPWRLADPVSSWSLTESAVPQTDVRPLSLLSLQSLAQLQEENMRLKQLVAELTLDKTMLQDVLSKKW